MRPSLIVLLAVGCTGSTPSGLDSGAGTGADSGGGSDSGSHGDDTATEPFEWDGTARLSDDQQFWYESAVTLPVAPLPPETDARLDWSGLSSDMLGLPFDPLAAGITGVLTHFGTISAEDLAVAVASDAIPQGDLVLYGTCDPGGTGGCSLSDYGLAGNDLEAEASFTPGVGTWMAALSSFDEEGAVRFRSLLVLEPDEAATGDTATFEEGACRFELEVELDAGQPLRVPVDTVPLLDWGALTVDGRGAALALQRLDRLRVAHFDTLGLSELEGRLPELVGLADSTWTWDVGGASSADLSELSKQGTSFQGFAADGLWLLSLECATCTSPMPLYLTVVEPVSP